MGQQKNYLTERSYREWGLLPIILDTGQVAILLGITRKFCNRLCKEKKLPCFMVGNRYKVRREDLQRYIEREVAVSHNA